MGGGSLSVPHSNTLDLCQWKWWRCLFAYRASKWDPTWHTHSHPIVIRSEQGLCVPECACVYAVKQYVAVKDAFSIVQIFPFSMNISGLYIRCAWDLHNSWLFRFLCVCVCVSGKLVELQFCDCMSVCVCPHDTLDILLATAVEMLLVPTLLSGDWGLGELDGWMDELMNGWIQSGGFDGWMEKRNC